jgi:hypothetical protein
MKMNKSLGFASALCILLLCGCASGGLPLQPIIDAKQAPAPDVGHVAGMFTRDWNPGKLGFGLGIVNTATAEEYVMPFGVETVLPKKMTDELGVIELPPGEYKVAYWVTYSTASHEQLSITGIPPDSLASAPFTLALGEVVFIGSLVADSGQQGGLESGNQWQVRHQRLTLQSAQKALSNRYSSFSILPMSCPTCIK